MLTTPLGQAGAAIVGQLFILGNPGRENIIRRRVDCQIQLHQNPVDFLIVDGVVQIRQMGSQRNRLQPFRELADVGRVVVFLNVLAGPGDGHAVQQLKEIIIQRAKQGFCGPFLVGTLAPQVKGLLCATEDFVDGLSGVQLVVD